MTIDEINAKIKLFEEIQEDDDTFSVIDAKTQCFQDKNIEMHNEILESHCEMLEKRMLSVEAMNEESYRCITCMHS